MLISKYIKKTKGVNKMAKNKKQKESKTKDFLSKWVTWRNVALTLVIGITVNNYSIIRLLLDQEQSIELVAGAVTIGLATFAMIGATLFRTKE